MCFTLFLSCRWEVVYDRLQTKSGTTETLTSEWRGGCKPGGPFCQFSIKTSTSKRRVAESKEGRKRRDLNAVWKSG